MKPLQCWNVITDVHLYQSFSPDAGKGGAQEQLPFALNRKTSLDAIQRRYCLQRGRLPERFPA
jgi:hypothetical protein